MQYNFRNLIGRFVSALDDLWNEVVINLYNKNNSVLYGYFFVIQQ